MEGYSEDDDMETRQRILGDPCGMASSEYWDEWFKIVSKGNAFEWYDQLAREYQQWIYCLHVA